MASEPHRSSVIPGSAITEPAITVIDLNDGRANQGVAAICQAIRDRHALPRVHDLRVEGCLPAQLGDGVILTGGPGSPTTSAPWRRRLQAALPNIAARVPVLGICLGFQVMASAWGWRLGPLPCPRFGVYHLARGTRPDRWLCRLPPGAAVFEQRRWAVWPAAGARGSLLATSLHGDALAVRFGPLAAGAVFHPEAAARSVATWLATDPAARAKAHRLQGEGSADQHVARAPELAHTFHRVLPDFVQAALKRKRP